MINILIIDDDVHIGNVLEETLTREGYLTARAYSGTEALLLLEQFRPDLILLLILIASFIYNSLCEPEFSDSMILTANGVQAGEPVLNPSYVSGLRRKVYEWLMEILPTGQAILIANEEAGHPVINIISSGIITVIVTICGIFAFRKKDLR